MSENKFENSLGEERFIPEAENMNTDENIISDVCAPAECEAADENSVKLSENPAPNSAISAMEEIPEDMHPADDLTPKHTATEESNDITVEDNANEAFTEAPDNDSVIEESSAGLEQISAEKADAPLENEFASEENVSESAGDESIKDAEENSLPDTDGESNADERIEDSAELTESKDASNTDTDGEIITDELNGDSAELTETEDISDTDKDSEDEEDDSEEPKKVKKPGSRGIDSLFDFVELFIFSLAAVFIITTFFFRHSVVDGSSMEQTLFDGEHIIISDLFYTPKRGDIVVCEDYSLEDEYMRKPIVKRVIAIAGDTVKIDRYGNVYVNGELLDESDYVYIDGPLEIPEKIINEEITIQEGEIFVMGDHRNVSADSRIAGPIKVDSVLGKVLFRFYPFEKFGAVE